MLPSPKWYNQLRWYVINVRAGGVCERCFVETATQAHHVCYPVGRREEARDLLALCDRCHYMAHYPYTEEPANDNEPEFEVLKTGTGTKIIPF